MVATENVFQRLGGAVWNEGSLWDRAMTPDSPGGCAITHDEADAIRRYHMREVRPLAAKSLTTVELVRSLVNGSDGHKSPRFVRAINGLLKREFNTERTETTG